VQEDLPPLLDEISCDSVVSELTGVKYQTTVDSFPTILQEKARETSNRRGSKCTLFVRPSKRSIIRYMKFLKLMKTKAEQATAARIEACSCFRNLFTFITANSIMSSKTLPHLMLNMDATQFRVGGTAADKVEVVVVKGANETNLKCKPQKKSSGITAYFIKNYWVNKNSLGE
jgi:hypothetical protein